MREPSRAEFGHFLSIAVKWGEMDRLGHVNNTVFYRYSEDGRIAYTQALTGDASEFGATATGPILAWLACDFRAQLRYPATVEIGTRVSRLGGASIQVEQCLFHAERDDVIAVYDSTLVWFDFDHQRSTRLPDELRAVIRAREPLAPAE